MEQWLVRKNGRLNEARSVQWPGSCQRSRRRSKAESKATRASLILQQIRQERPGHGIDVAGLEVLLELLRPGRGDRLRPVDALPHCAARAEATSARSRSAAVTGAGGRGGDSASAAPVAASSSAASTASAPGSPSKSSASRKRNVVSLLCIFRAIS